MRKALAFALGAMALIGLASAGEAAERRAKLVASADSAAQPKVRHHRRHAARARGYRPRVGGYYSYRSEDVVNTYGLTRGLFGGVNSYRDPFTDRQTSAGPFDHGFFFDSGMAPRGGDSPYLH